MRWQIVIYVLEQPNNQPSKPPDKIRPLQQAPETSNLPVQATASYLNYLQTQEHERH